MTDKIEMFRSYLQKKPGDRFAMYGLALELNNVGRTDEAERAFRDLLSVHPHSGAGHYQLGLLLADAEREDEAQLAWEAGLEALTGAKDAEARRSRVEIQGALDLL